jgi:hypothetical protein
MFKQYLRFEDGRPFAVIDKMKYLKEKLKV